MAVPTQSVHAGAVRNASERARELAARQHGVVARWQLLRLGLTRSRIAHWLRSGRLHPRYPGVYALGRPDLPVEGELWATVLLAGPGAALDGLTALWWQGLLGRRPYPTTVATPRRCVSRRDVHISRQPELRRALHRGIPVVPLPRALLAASARLSRDSLRLVLARAEYAKLLSLADLESALGSGHVGSSAVRAAMGGHLPQLARCANRFEREFVLLCERRGLPIPDPNVRIGRHRPDMLWREASLIAELDGFDAHSTAAQLASDRSRQAVLERRGFTVVRFGWEDVHRRPGAVTAELAARLGL